MVEKLYVAPGSIRGGGLLVDSKGAEEYICKTCILSKTSTTIDDESVALFTMQEAIDTILAISSDISLIVNNYLFTPYVEAGTFSIGVSLTDEDENALSGKSVTFISQDKPTSETVTTDSSGEATATFNKRVGTYSIQASYSGDTTSTPKLANAVSNILKVRVGGCDISLEALSSRIYLDGAVDLRARVVIDGVTISNVPVTFYADGTYLGSNLTNSSGLVSFRDYFQSIGTKEITACVGSESSEPVFVRVLPEVSPSNVAMTGPAAVQQNTSTNLTASVTGINADEETVGVGGVNVDFYEEFTPLFTISANKPIIQKDEVTTITTKLRDSVDNSKVIIPNIPVDFYELYDGITLEYVGESSGGPGDIITLKVTSSHADDSPFSGTVNFYEDGNFIGIGTLSNTGEYYFNYMISNKAIAQIHCVVEGVTSNTLGIINDSSTFNERIDVVWSDSDSSNRPESITAFLIVSDTIVAEGVLDESTDWSYDFTGLPRYDGVSLISYSIVLDEIDLYSTSISKSSNVSTATLTYNGGTASYVIIAEIDSTGDSNPPSGWRFKLDGREVVVSESNDYTATLTDIPLYKNGELYTPQWTYDNTSTTKYVLQSRSVDGYVTSVALKYVNIPTPDLG